MCVRSHTRQIRLAHSCDYFRPHGATSAHILCVGGVDIAPAELCMARAQRSARVPHDVTRRPKRSAVVVVDAVFLGAFYSTH